MWLKTTKPWDTFFITTFVRSYLPGIGDAANLLI